MHDKRVLVVGMVLAFAAVVGAGEPPAHLMVVNDDGIDAPGIAALAAELDAEPDLRVTVVAPATHQSGKGHSITTHGPIRVLRYEAVGGCPAWSVAASPATTVRLGLTTLVADDPPDLVVSGINRGENDGLAAWYSGTVGAAREAVIAGTPGLALSLELNWEDPDPDFAAAARWAVPVVRAVLEDPLPPDVLLNVNIPRRPGAARGYRLCRMAHARASMVRFDSVGDAERDDVRDYRPVWRPAVSEEIDTDTWSLEEGWVTIVPLGLEQTAWRAYPLLGWARGLEPPRAEGAP